MQIARRLVALAAALTVCATSSFAMEDRFWDYYTP